MRIRVLLLFILVTSIVASAMYNFAAGEDGNKGVSTPKTAIYFDRYSYVIGQKATVTIVDKKLDRHYDAVDSYRPTRGFVSFEINDNTVSDGFATKVFRTSFRETGPHTGIFKAMLKIPSTDEFGHTIKGKEIRINYLDIHNRVIWHDTATVL